MRAPRKQALRLTEWLTRERPSLRAVLLGGRREGKSDLLAQIHASLFERAEGPLPFLFRLAAPAASLSTSHDRQQATSHDRQQALRFAASFCQQMRAFLLRQEEVLGEPPGELAMEMDRPGLPLSLAELCRELLIAPTDSSGDATVLALVSRLPARFAHREGRPVCNLWDDCHTLAPDHPFFGALEAGPGLHIDLNQDLSKDLNRESATVCSLLTGFEPPMRRLAGARAWTALPLDPFASSEALLLAESCCKASGLRFSREVWETWFAVAGTSPGWAAPLIESAALRGEPIESLEQLARIYSDELNGGSLGQWLEVRWPLPAPAAVAHQAPQAVAENLQRGEAAALSADEVASPTDSSAPAEERGGGAQAAQRLNHGQWLRQRPFSLESTLGAVERDWLRLELNRAKIGSGRARARLIQEFLLRATRALSGQQASEETPRSTLLEVIEERLGLPIAPLLVAARVVAPSGDELLLPQIFSVAREPVASAECAAELFWCYGARPGARPAHRQSEPRGQRTAKKAPTSAPTSASGLIPSLLLLAHCESHPTKALVAEWARELQHESSSGETELWVVVPKGGPLAPTGDEKRLSNELLLQLLGLDDHDEPVESALLSSSREPSTLVTSEVDEARDSEIQGIEKRLEELRVRARRLQNELRSQEKVTSPRPPSSP